MKGKSSLWITFILVASVMANVAVPMVGQATPDVKVFLDPSTNVAEEGEWFTVDINVADVLSPGVSSWDFKLGWDPDILYTSDEYVTEGDFLKKAGPTHLIKAVSADYMQIGCMLMGPGGATGSGILATVSFQVVGTGKCALDLYDTKLFDPDLSPIGHTHEDGLFYTTYPKAGFIYYTEVHPPLSAGIQPTFNPVVGETIFFNATLISYDGKYGGSHDPDGDIMSYSWDFDDGNTPSVTDPVITHVYDAVGTYLVNLTVTDDDEKKDWIQTPLTVVIHDIAIINIEVESTIIKPGELPYINVTVKNEGTEDYPQEEYFNVTCYYDDDAIWYNKTKNQKAFSLPLEIDPVTSLPPAPPLHVGENMTITFIWNTTLVAEDTYNIWANACIVEVADPSKLVPGETDTADNTYDYGTVTVTKGTPIANFTISPEHPIVDETITFDASDSSDLDGTIESYEWDFGDGNTGTEVTTTHAYTADGTYTVTLTVTDDDGLTGTETKSITLAKPPVADFTYSPSTPATGETVTFDALDSEPNGGTIDMYSWDFNNDGTIDATTIGTGMTHVYTTFGTYTVNLTITDSEGLTDSKTKSITVLAPPIALFTYLPTAPKSGETITFDASTSSDPDGTIVSWAWDFNDDDVIDATTKTATWTYTADDIYYITLTVTDDDGLTNAYEKTVTVSEVPVHDVAVTNVTASPSEVVIGNIVSINVTVANEGNTEETFNVTVYYDSTLIDMELDVTLSVGNHITLNFLWNTTGIDEGTYTVEANATQVPDETDTADNLFTDGTVMVSPVSMHDVAVTSVTAPAEVTEGDNASIDVDVSNLGDFEETFNVTLTYDTTLIKTESITLTSENSTTISFTWNTTGVTPDTYTITAEAILSTDEDLTNNNATTSITVSSELDSPVASFTFTPTEPITSQTVTFNASASYDLDGTITIYSWNFDDGDTGTGETTTHAYTTGGTYTVTLTVTDNDGLTDTATQSISITGGKLSSSVSITVSPTAITIGKGTIIIGFITPARVGANVTIESKIGEGDWSNITTATTIQWGAYLYTWTPTAVGTYQIRARWLGDSITYANVSDVKTVTVKEMFGTISLEVTPPSVSFGSSVGIVGKVEPERPGVWVYINVRKNGGDWTLLLVMITDSKGNYSYEWTPTDTGTYELQAMCKYDIDILGSESEIRTITVKAVGVPLDIYIYAAFVATTIILAGVLAVYFFRKRKT